MYECIILRLHEFMANQGRQNLTNNQTPIASLTSTLKAYSIPLLLLVAAVFFQLVVLPRNYPTSYYDVLGIPKYSSVEDVKRAYETITSKWNSSVEVLPSVDLIKVQYAFELLTNELLKRDYDIYDIDEHFHVLEKVKEHHSGKQVSGPLIEAASSDPADRDFTVINSENFLSKFEDDKALLLQIISFGSTRCAKFSNTWKRAVHLLDGVANSGVVELGDVHLAAYLAEKKKSGQPSFRNGLPALLAFPPGCKSSGCLRRYEGDLSVDAITDWFTTSILNLPRILYYSKESLVQNFLAKSKPHQVKVIFLSRTGERATPIIRQAAKDYSPYAAFAFTLWKEEESTFWWNMLGVESAPAIVVLRDPGVEPVVYQGSLNSSMFIDIMEKNKNHVLPQLRNLTSLALGCDARGYSRAGIDAKIWYCAIVAGRPSRELNKMREIMRSVQDELSNNGETDIVEQDPTSASAILALREKRLTFVWLDGEAQDKYCFFHIHSEDSFETCGPRKGITDVARVFIVRYERIDNDEKPETQKKQAHNVFSSWHQSEASDPTSVIVAKYNGSSDVSEIIKWTSEIIKDGDSRKIPPFKARTPELVPEDAGATWSQSSKKLLPSGVNVKQSTRGFISSASDYLADPRVGPSLLLVSLMAFGRIWMNRSRAGRQTTTQNETNQPENEDEIPREWRDRRRDGANQAIPPSIPDLEPVDAKEMSLSDSDSDSQK